VCSSDLNHPAEGSGLEYGHSGYGQIATTGGGRKY
jgi:hypothetical protein